MAKNLENILAMVKTLRKLICSIFGFEALCFLVASVTFFLNFFRRIGTEDSFANPEGGLRWIPGILILLVFFVIVPAVVAIAWWTSWRKARLAWVWGIVASVINIGLSLPAFFFRGNPFPFVTYGFGVFGVLGVIVFLGWRSPVEQAEPEQALAKVAGDGTHSFLNRSSTILVSLLGVAFAEGWWHWSRGQELPYAMNLGSFLTIIPVLAVSIFVHELGHALAAESLGMKICSVVLGPFDWRIREGKWKFTFSKRLGAVGGAVGVVSTRADEPRWYRIWVSAAGPLANLFLALVGFVMAITAKGSSYESYWGFWADMASISTLMLVTNIVPLRVAGFYTDGAKIYQIISGGMWADYHRVQAQVASTGFTNLRPREYDLAAIERLIQRSPSPFHTLLGWMYIYECHLDGGETAAAGEALMSADQASREAESSLTPELCTEFVYSMAILTGDASRTRDWWNRLESFPSTEHKWDYWLAHSALHWIEGDAETANESWQRGNLLAQQLPKAGGYEFDRHCIALLRQAMDEVPVAV